jgi:hypothetical protein
MDLATLGGLPLQDPESHEVRLADLWRDRPLVLLFVRHFG